MFVSIAVTQLSLVEICVLLQNFTVVPHLLLSISDDFPSDYVLKASNGANANGRGSSNAVIKIAYVQFKLYAVTKISNVQVLSSKISA